MLDPLDLAEREFPSSAILECNDNLSVLLARTEHARLSLHVHRPRQDRRQWIAELAVNGEAVAIVGKHTDLAEVLRMGRSAAQAIAGQLCATLAIRDGAQEKATTG